MRKIIEISKNTFLILLLSILNLCAFGQKTVRVSTIDELFEAIASNTTIELEEGNYDISKIDNDKKTNSAKMQILEDGINYEFYVNGVSNLKIIGIGKKQSKINTPNPSVTVMNFRNCKNVVLENIDAGHKANKGDCSANVINLFDCENFSIKNSILYGSGYTGIFANGVKRLSLSKTTITDCSYRLFDLTNCMNTKMDSCMFTKTSGGITIDNCIGVTISNSEFSENKNETTLSEDGTMFLTYLFEITSSTNIKLIKTLIENNITSYFVKSSKSLTIDEDVDFKDNGFLKTFEE